MLGYESIFSTERIHLKFLWMREALSPLSAEGFLDTPVSQRTPLSSPQPLKVPFSGFAFFGGLDFSSEFCGGRACLFREEKGWGEITAFLVVKNKSCKLEINVQIKRVTCWEQIQAEDAVIFSSHFSRSYSHLFLSVTCSWPRKAEVFSSTVSISNAEKTGHLTLSMDSRSASHLKSLTLIQSVLSYFQRGWWEQTNQNRSL